MKSKRPVFLTIAMGCLIAASAAALCAQDCVTSLPHEMQWQSAGAVFYGRLIEVRVVDGAKEAARYEMTFKREEVWKGPKTVLLKVIAYSGFSYCTKSYPFKPDNLQIDAMYLVYARAPFNLPDLPPKWIALGREYSVSADTDLFKDAGPIAAQKKLLGKACKVRPL